MKAKLLFICLLILGSTGGTYAQSDLFEKLSDEKKITVITITKALLNMMSKESIDQIDMGGIKISKLLDRMEQIDVLTTEDVAAKKLMRDGVKSSIQNNKVFERTMRVKEENSEVNFYIERGNGNLIKSIIMFVDDEEDESVLIRLLGRFTLEEVQKMTVSFSESMTNINK